MLTTTDFDVAVIGAGINGASAARELALAGYSVLLAERSDLASGASSRSSRMLHCGLRYFETAHPFSDFLRHPRRFAGALKMARASMEARRELVETAADHVKPFTMCFPIYPDSTFRPHHLDLGLNLLKLAGPRYPPLEYRRISSDALPFAGYLRDPDRLQTVATYREYLLDWPERFCVDCALDAERFGATVLTFCEARVAGRSDDGRWKIQLDDRRSRQITTVGADLVFNMAGIGIDAVNEGAARTGPAPRRLVRGTKGAHIMVRLPEAFRGFGIATLHRGGMPFYCLPSHDDFFFFGPTETPVDSDDADVCATDDDIDFLLGEANFILPGLELKRSDVAFSWAGVRPLTYAEDQPMGRRTRRFTTSRATGCPASMP